MRIKYTTEREYEYCSKAVYIAVLQLEKEAEKLGIDPAFSLAEQRLMEARKTSDENAIAFATDIFNIACCREFFGWDALYVLSD